MTLRLCLLFGIVFGWISGYPGLDKAHGSPQNPPERRPNILLIIGDDHGWPYAGFMGDEVAKTPNLDQLAEQGTVFTNAHNTASVCRPSLLTFLAGVHLIQWNEKRERLEQRLGPIRKRTEIHYYRTLPKELKKVGYTSWQAGKYWEHTYSGAGFDGGLADRPQSFLRPAAGGKLFGRSSKNGGSVIQPFLDFLDDTGDQPFFAMLTPMLPHLPYTDDPERLAYYKRLAPSGYKAVPYYANVTWLDDFVGEVVRAIDRRGLGKTTLVIYASDNGWKIGSDLGITSQQGGGKLTLSELGFRTPLILRWPEHIPAGVVRDDLVSTLDIFPTILDYAGAPQLEDRRGLNLRPAIESGEPFERTKLIAHQLGRHPYSTGTFVRTRRWRYIAFASGREELYRIDLDPFEEDDVARNHPEAIREFRADVRVWKAALASNPLDCEACEQAEPDRGP